MTAVISITTIPDRIEHIEPCLKSLVKQGLPVHLWIVKKIERSKTVLKRIPPFVHDLEGIVFEIVEDRGPITKILPALEAGYETILTADDDRYYGPGWASDLLKWSQIYPGAAIGYRGRIFDKTRKYEKSRIVWNPEAPKRVDIITGCRGALYRSAHFDKGIFEDWKLWPRNDDIVISSHLSRQDVRLMIVPCKFKTRPTPAYKIKPLYDQNAHRKKLNNLGLRKMYSGKRQRRGEA